MNIKTFILGKLIFPKTVLIDQPGIIISQSSRFYSNTITRRRMIFLFEDTIALLQKETINELGEKKAKEIWYKIGKDISLRYFALAGVKSIPKLLIPAVIEHMLLSFRAGGISINEKIEIDVKKRSLAIEGKEVLFERKSGDGSIFAGMASAILSTVFKENIEANSIKKGKRLIIVANPKIKRKYRSKLDLSEPAERYNYLNFPSKINLAEKMHSISDHMKFGKAKIEASGKWVFLSEIVFPTEPGLLGLIYHHYKSEKYTNLLEKNILKSTHLISKKIIKAKKTEQKLNILKQISSALGWGIISINKKKKVCNINLSYTYFTKYNKEIMAIILKGFLESIFNQKFSRHSISEKKRSYSTLFRYYSA